MTEPEKDADAAPQDAAAGGTDAQPGESGANESSEAAAPESAADGEDLERILSDEDRAEKRSARADEIIKRHMGYSMASGAIPIPLLDLTALATVQLDLIKTLARLYQVPFDARSARAFVTSLGSAAAGRMLAKLGAASVAKLIPGIGGLLGAAAGVTLNGAFTFAVGTVVKHHFAAGLPLEELDVARIKDEMGVLIEAGRKQATELVGKVRGRNAEKE